MGPKIVSLACSRQRHSPSQRGPASGFAVWALLAILAPIPAIGTEVPTERETVRRHLLDVSVLPPGEDSWRSAPGIPKDAFRILIDGEPLSEERRAQMEFDEICPQGGAGADEHVHPSRAPTLIVLADLNYLDVGMRHATARALEDLADSMEGRDIRVKVFAYTRELIPLSDGFTDRPDEVRSAAKRLIATVSPGPPLREPETRAESSRPQGEETIADRQTTVTTSAGGRAIPAFELSPSGELRLNEESLFDPLERSPDSWLVAQPIDPRPSLAAIESALISHAAIPGRKAVVLFSSGRFDLPEELWLTYMMRPLHAAQAGFVLWTVNASGLRPGRGRSARSSLLGHLGGATGGGRIRGAGRLSVAFDRAIEQLSCYYLFSLPIEAPKDRSERHTVTVSLDTEEYPELWTYRVRSPTSFVLLDERSRAERRRLAALMEPKGYEFPNVRVHPTYPGGGAKKLIAPIEVSVRLSDLLFEEGAGSGEGTSARFAWEGVVTGASDVTVCRLGDGRVRQLGLERAPLSDPTARLVLRDRCALPGAGEYDVRAVVEDLNGDTIGGGRARFRVFEPGDDTARISSVRLGRNTGKDFLLDLRDNQATDVPRDRFRQAFVPLMEGEALDPSDQLMVRFVACRSSKPPHVVLYERSDDEPRALYQLLVAGRTQTVWDTTKCREYEAALEGGTLRPGRYGIALFAHDVDATTRDDVDRLLREGKAAAGAVFEVRRRIPTDPGFEAPSDPA
jgi:hypothetical protein